VTAKKPDRVRIRSYNVGFGDCYLLTFRYSGERDRNVLIDFGSSEASTFTPDLTTVASQIRTDCGGKLDVVVATHRHSDHISGFGDGPGSVIASLAPQLVVQPWTEDPELDPKATGRPAGGSGARELASRTHVSRLSDLQAFAAAVAGQVARLNASHVPRTLSAQIRFLGMTNIRNRAAVEGLASMGSRRVYASFGTRLPISRVLPGVRVDVLGPPTLDQSKKIRRQTSKDPIEFWHLTARRAEEEARTGPDRPPLFPGTPVARAIPQEARWVIPQVDRMRAEEMLAIVRTLDGVLNNTSLILLFHVGETRLLFPGDAQIENWSYALFTADRQEEIREQLADVRFYKVGHHGSLNATPKTLWNAFTRASETEGPDRLATFVSTLAGKHGSKSRGTEVPRRTLIKELELKSNLGNTQKIRSRKTFWIDQELDL
jgi:hypothetical protein